MYSKLEYDWEEIREVLESIKDNSSLLDASYSILVEPPARVWMFDRVIQVCQSSELDSAINVSKMKLEAFEEGEIG